MDVQLGRPEANLETARALAAAAAEQGANLILFPELWSTGYDLERAAAYATPVDQGIFAEMGNLARRHGLAVAGSCLASRHDGCTNTAVLFTSDGRLAGSYDKIHLFGLMEEDRYLRPGDGPVLVAPGAPWGPTGLAICYDLRFPELFRAYALAGAQMVLIPAEWPHVRLAHWRTLLRARAIENQMVVIACNRAGDSKGERFGGYSAIIDPWGETVCEAGEEACLLTAEIDLDLAADVRRRIPVLADRRPANYDLAGAALP
jgi:predicted amidohydrolase